MGEPGPGPAGVRPLVSVVVLGYNGRDHLRVCLPSLLRQTYPRDRLEVIVVDNGSADGTADFVAARFPTVRLIRNPRNDGFAAGCNLGARAAAGEFVAFLNQDAEPDPAWIAELLAAILAARARGDASLVCAGAKILSWDGATIDFAGSRMNFIGKGAQEGFRQPVSAAYDVARPLLFACGGAMLIDRAVFLDIGGFDEDFFLFFEDVDLGWRLWVMGYRAELAPRAVAYHRLHGSTGELSDAGRWRLYERNALFAIVKNYDDDHLHRVLPAALLLTVDQIAAETERAGPTDADGENRVGDRPAGEAAARPPGRAALAALRELTTALPGLMAKRAAIQARRRRSDAEITPLFVGPLEPLGYVPGHAALTFALAEQFGVGELFAHAPRRVLVVTPALPPLDGLPPDAAGARAWALGQGLAARGHHVHFTVHASQLLAGASLVPDRLRASPWDETTLSSVVDHFRPDAVIACGAQAMAGLGNEWTSVVLDVAATGAPPPPDEGETGSDDVSPWPAALRRADLVVCGDEQQRRALLPWLRLSRLVPVSVILLPDPPASDPALANPALEGLDRFVRRPSGRPVAPPEADEPTWTPPSPSATGARPDGMAGLAESRPAPRPEDRAPEDRGRGSVMGDGVPERISVIVPTCNRPDLLARALEGLEAQTWPRSRFEVIVVDDGGDEPAAPVVAAAAARGLPVVGERQQRAGLAAARNLGLRRATGPVVAFLDDDCVPEPGWLEAHALIHTRPDLATIGHIDWHPELMLTPLMRFVGERFVFRFDLIGVAEDAPFPLFSTANAAANRALALEAGLFDESFRGAAWEDGEFAYRLRQRGARFLYRPEAVVQRLRGIDLADFLRRERSAGREAVRTWRKHPELERLTGVTEVISDETEFRFFESAGRYAWLVGAAEAIGAGPAGAAALELVTAELGAEPELARWRSERLREHERQARRDERLRQEQVESLRRRLLAQEETITNLKQRIEEMEIEGERRLAAFDEQRRWAHDLEQQLLELASAGSLTHRLTSRLRRGRGDAGR